MCAYAVDYGQKGSGNGKAISENFVNFTHTHTQPLILMKRQKNKNTKRSFNKYQNISHYYSVAGVANVVR